MKKASGFTLVEAVVSLFIGSLMMVAIYTIVNLAQRSSSGIERRVIAQQDARAALELMAMEIRMASYNPTLTSNIWVDPTDCFSIVSATNQTYKGIQAATENSIAIEMDIGPGLDGDGAIGDPNEIIKYNYDTTGLNRYITRETNCGGGGQPFLGNSEANAALGKTRTVRVVNNELNPVIPVFRYYNGSGTEIAAPVTASIPDIRRIEITLAVEAEDVDPNTNTRKRIIYSTSVIPRNHIPVPTY